MAVQYRSKRLKILLGVALALGCARGFAAPPDRSTVEQEYRAQLDRRDWGAAILSAEKLVSDARAAADAQPQQLADALTLLGDAQFGSNNLVGAQAAYEEALAITEPRVSPGSEKLLEPTRGLGYTFAAAGKHAQAVPLLEKALVVSRRNQGLFHPSQQGVLRQLASSLTSLDEAAEAERHLLYLLRIGERSYGARDVRMAPLLCVVGDWYTQIGNLGPAREIYRTALNIAEGTGGKASLAAIEPLRALAASYRRELFLSGAGLLRPPEHDPGSIDTGIREVRPITAQFLNNEGERALLRAVKILEANPAHPGQLMIDTLTETGDWYQIRSQPQKAFPFYRRAAALAPEATGADALSPPFSFPVQVYLPTPLLATRNRFRPDAEIDQRFVQVEFTVTSEGAVKDEHVVDQDATSRQAAETLDAIRAARYRPRFINGEPVATAAVGYRQVFRQRKDKDAEKEKDS